MISPCSKWSKLTKLTKLSQLVLPLATLLVALTLADTASIYYEKPSSARLAAPTHSPPACTYQSKKYQHGQQVSTPEPCLNCTCRKGVLLCFLRVCPTLMSTSDENCKTIREPGQCCPVLKCETQNSSALETSAPTSTAPTTKALSGFGQSNDDNSLVPNQLGEDSKDNVLYYSAHISTPSDMSSKTTTENRIFSNQKDKITTTIFQTSPSSSFGDSLLMVTSSPTQEDINEIVVNAGEGSCHLNGTVYAEGSAVMSTSFCEYCYCIKSKRMCIRPRCHLSIMGCLPRYTSEYACCPTNYVCGDEAMTTLPMTTTTLSPTTSTAAQLSPRKSVCTVDGVEYQVGDAMASDQHCKQCYCSTGGIKKCKKIQCSPEMEGCVPVIPEGHCCPVEYKCNSTIDLTTLTITASETTTSSSLTNESATDENLLNVEVEGGVSINLGEDTSYGLSISSENNETQFLNSETTISSEVIVTTELFPSQTESTINGKQIISDNMIIGRESQYNNSIEDQNESTETPIIATIEPMVQNITPNESLDKIETTDHSQQLVANDSNSLSGKSLSETTLSPIFNNASSLLENTTTNSPFESPTTVSSIQTTIGLLDHQHIPNDNPIEEKSEAKQIQNGTYESVGLLLRGIIDAIDQQLQKAVPVEPRTQENNSSHVLEANQSTNSSQLKPSQLRSEEKRGPSLSSSFFITDNNEKPYKLDSEGVEIITAKTAFYDIEEHPSRVSSASASGLGDSILVNLSPSSLKVGASSGVQNANGNRDKNFDVLGQNNRATVYGKPGHVSAHSPIHSAHSPTYSAYSPTHSVHSPTHLAHSPTHLAHSPTHSAHSPTHSAHSPTHSAHSPTNSAHSPTHSAHSGLSAHLFPQIIKPSNDWRAVGGNVEPIRRPDPETSVPSRPIDSLYYTSNMRRNDDSDESEDSEKNSSDVDKRPRLEFDINNDQNNRMKVIPFKVNDAFSGMSPKKKNGSFLIRVSSPNKNSVAQESTPKTVQLTSCFYNNMEYPNGAMIPKPDPCTLCRCFYGRELCQQQKCPAPPEKECMPENMPGYCCPRYICRVTEEHKSQQRPPIVAPIPEMSDSSGIRTGIHLPTTSDITSNKTIDINNDNPLPVLTHNMADVDRNRINGQHGPDMAGPHMHYNPPTVTSTPKPFQRISGIAMKQKPNENRIHFPSDNFKDQRVDSVISQPLLTDSSPLTSRPSKPVGSQGSPNKFRLKPGPAMPPMMGSQSPLSNPNKPNLRLPPFLLHNHNSGNGHQHQPISTRHKTSTTIAPQLEDFSQINHSNNDSLVGDKESIQSNGNHSSDILTSESTRNNSVVVELNLSTITPSYSSSTISTSTKPTSTSTTAQSTVSPTTTSTQSSKPKESEISSNSNRNKKPWDLFRVSGCNIYGTMYEINAQIDRLSTTCKTCICSVEGVKCTDIC